MPTQAVQAAAAVVPDPSWHTLFADVPASSGVTLASGILAANGTAASGSTVILWADADPTAPVAVSQTTTDDTGAWSIAVPSATDLTSQVDPSSGHVNFFVQTFDEVGSSVYYFSASSAPTATAAVATGTSLVGSGQAKARGKTIALATDRANTSHIRLDSGMTHIQHRSQAAASTALSPDLVEAPDACHFTTLATYTNVKTLLGYTADEASGTAEHLVYTAGATSTLGVGVEGESGFSASGTRDKSSTVTANFPATHNVQYENYYGTTTYSKIRETCGGKAFSNTVSVVPSDLTGGFSYSAAGQIAMGNCVGVQQGITVTKQQGTAYTVGAGVDISSFIGIDLSAKTGYSTQTSIDYAFNGAGHPWCGKDAPPAGTSSSHLQTIHASIFTG